MIRHLILGLALAASVPALAQQAPPPSLDALLKQVRESAAASSKLNQEREQRFLRSKNEQAAMLQKAESDAANARARADAVRARFAAQQKEIADLKAQLQARAGDYGQVQGTVKEIVGDFRAVASESLISAQYPDRMPLLDRLAAGTVLPSVSDLEQLWLGLQEELTESGKVSRFKAPVFDTQGRSTEAEVVRIGSFTAIADGHYLVINPENLQLTTLPQQPGHGLTGIAEAFAAADQGIETAVIDPSRGSLVAQEALRPTLKERVDLGGSIAYVIIAIGIVAAIVSVWQLFYLLRVGARMRRQLGSLGTPTDDNPLGRVLSAFQGDPARGIEDPEVLELRLSEAILREVPALERFQSFLRLVVAAGPLLGLIGTVVGMIVTFQVITEQGAGDPRLMAAGISQAMIDTVLGLGIAVPTLFINALLSARSQVLVQILDEQSAGLLAKQLEQSRAAGRR